jgi:hypothetical protein
MSTLTSEASSQAANLSAQPFEGSKQTADPQLLAASNKPEADLYSFDFDPVKLKAFKQQAETSVYSNINKDLDYYKKRLLNPQPVNSNLSSCMTIEEANLEELYSRCEALHAHGFLSQACILAQLLSENLLKSSSNTQSGQSIFNLNLNAEDSLDLSMQGSKQNRAKCISHFQSTVLWRSHLLCSILYDASQRFVNLAPSSFQSLIVVDHLLAELNKNVATSTNLTNSKTSKLNQLAFRVGLFGLETPRLPAISKSLEVKLINQEQELAGLLKRLDIGSLELGLVKQRAQTLRTLSPRQMLSQSQRGFNYNYHSLPITLASFIFECLQNHGSSSELQPNVDELSDQELAFEACLTVLGMRATISESQHALLCEGIRRQRGELALTLLLTYKDCEERLIKIMDRILDRDVYVLFKRNSFVAGFNPFNPNLKKIQQQQLQEYIELDLDNINNSNNQIEQPNQPTTQTATQTNVASLNTTSTINTSIPTQTSSGAKQDDQNAQVQKVSQNVTTTVPVKSVNLGSSNRRVLAANTTAMDSLSSGWEESENESSNLSGDVALLEAKYKCLSMRNQHQNQAAHSGTLCAPPTTLALSQSQQQSHYQSSTSVAGSTTATLIGKEADVNTSSGDNSPTTVTVRKPIIMANVASGALVQTSSSKSCSKTVDDSGDDSVPEEEQSSRAGTSSSSCENILDKKKCSTTTETAKTSELTTSEPTSTNLTSTVTNQTSVLNDTSLLSQPINKKITSLTQNAPQYSTLNSQQPYPYQQTAPHHHRNNMLNFNTSKFNYNNLINQMNSHGSSMNPNRQFQLFNHQPASEAMGHFMFEFSKQVLTKAGGSVNSTSVFLNANHHANNQQPQVPTGPHRNLHICSFLILLYSLGLHNAAQPNWLSRTYSSHVTWVNSQAVDIGFPAICILIECWQGLLTPSECVSLADRVSRGRDNMAVKAAAELALSSLRYAHLTSLNEIQRALVQCKEQGGGEMLQRACTLVEQAVKEGAQSSQLLEILFSVAKRWDDLYIESVRSQQAAAVAAAVANTTQQQQQQNSQTSSVINSVANPLQFGQMNQAVSNNQTSQNNPNMPFGTLPFNLMNQPAMTAQILPLLIQQSLMQQQQMYNNNGNATNNHNNRMNPQMGQQPIGMVDTFFPLNQFFNYQQQQQQQIHFQNLLRQHQQLQQQQQQMAQQTSSLANVNQMENATIDPVALRHLTSAFRVGMLGLEALPKRVDGGSHQIKYRQSPPYADDVKWLWEIAIKLDSYLKTSTSLQQFCQAAAIVVQNPFLLQELAFDTANYLTRSNPSQFTMVLSSPGGMLAEMVSKCIGLYTKCCTSKLSHLNPQQDIEDFANMLITARNLYYYSGNMHQFQSLMQHLKNHKSSKAKRDVWAKICHHVNNYNQ